MSAVWFTLGFAVAACLAWANARWRERRSADDRLLEHVMHPDLPGSLDDHLDTFDYLAIPEADRDRLLTRYYGVDLLRLMKAASKRLRSPCPSDSLSREAEPQPGPGESDD